MSAEFNVPTTPTLHQRVLNVERKLKDFNRNELGLTLGLGLNSATSSKSISISPPTNLGLKLGELGLVVSARPKNAQNHHVTHNNHHHANQGHGQNHHNNHQHKSGNVPNLGSMTAPLPKRPLPLVDRSPVGDWPTGSGRKRPTFAPPNRQPDSMEIDRRLEEIMKLTGILRIQGKEYKSEPEDLQDVSPLGNGTCGHVIKMLHQHTISVMAVKKMRRSGNKEENKRIIMDLDVVMRSHDCPYIVQSFGCFITDSEVWICMEMMATCLDKLLKRIKTGIPEHIIGKMAVSIVKGLNYLKEKQGIIHRDVKPSNILLDWDGTVKLCDFGISGRLVDSKVRSKTAGCVGYLAPERIEFKNEDYDIRADVWSFGISLIELATGRSPYANCTAPFELLVKIVNEPAPGLTPEQGFSPLFCNFVNFCLTKNFHERPKYTHLLKTEFIRLYEMTPVDVGQWFKDVVANSTADDDVSRDGS